MEKNITLYTYPTSPYGMKVGCYLKYKKLKYNFVPVNPVVPKQIKFTRQRQVPVLKIGDEWRKDSSKIGTWLDTLYPEYPLLRLNEEENARLLEIDKWVSNQLIPSYVFRNAVEWDSIFMGLHNGWTLAKSVHSATPIPLALRVLWPILIKNARFIVRMMDMVDMKESKLNMRKRLTNQFEEHLADGPYLGGLTEPSLADLSAFPVIVFGSMMGLKAQGSTMLDNPAILNWAHRIQSRLPRNPLLIPDELMVNFTL